MKIARINFIVQTALVALLLFLLLAMIFEKGFLVWILFLYLLIGGIQYFTGWILKIFFPHDQALKRYLVFATLALALIALSTLLPGDAWLVNELRMTIIFIVPWVLVVYYWYLTFKGYLQRFFKNSFFQ
ncbi:MAG: hypothetical protein AAFO69_11265 [Bacteroidota bacterium]